MLVYCVFSKQCQCWFTVFLVDSVNVGLLCFLFTVSMLVYCVFSKQCQCWFTVFLVSSVNVGLLCF